MLPSTIASIRQPSRVPAAAAFSRIECKVLIAVNVHAALINHAASLTPEAANAGGGFCWIQDGVPG